MAPAEQVQEDLIEAATISSWFLRFPAHVEARFEREVSAERCRRLVAQNWIGLAIYVAFLAGDWLLVRDIFWFSVFLHLCVMTPIMVGVNAVIRREPPVWLREGLLAVGIVLAVVAILGLTLASRSPLRTSEHLSVVLVILFATMVQRMRFGYVVATCLTSGVLYVATVSHLGQDAPWQRQAVASAVFCGVILFAVISCWNLEREQRSNYLLQLRDRVRNSELEALSRRDPLTGAGNRRALDEALGRCGGGAAGRRSTAVLLFDIDHFKSFNDANGHLAGDACLRYIASLIGAEVRDGVDRHYRFGGEEFVVLLESVDLAGACGIAERIRTVVRGAAIARDREGGGTVTLSAGVAVAFLETDLERHALLAAADGALYAAKRGGRDRVCSASGLVELPRYFLPGSGISRVISRG